MGEIKSTLDLVMERTRHLSLSDEEKQRQQTETFEKRLQGLLQQYADGALSIEQLRERITTLETQLKTPDRQIVMAAVVKRVDPDRENVRWLDLLAQVAPDMCAPLHDALMAYRPKRDNLLAAGAQGQLEGLARHHGIKGTAVVPNPRQDPVCQEQLAELRNKTQAGFEAILNQNKQVSS